jgi:hypothetical protein
VEKVQYFNKKEAQQLLRFFFGFRLKVYGLIRVALPPIKVAII